MRLVFHLDIEMRRREEEDAASMLLVEEEGRREERKEASWETTGIASATAGECVMQKIRATTRSTEPATGHNQSKEIWGETWKHLKERPEEAWSCSCLCALWLGNEKSLNLTWIEKEREKFRYDYYFSPTLFPYNSIESSSLRTQLPLVLRCQLFELIETRSHLLTDLLTH